MNKLETRELLTEPLTEYAKEKIVNDLEILEIFKKYLCRTGDGGYMLFPYVRGRSKDARKIKEWLNNEINTIEQ